jgi:aminopeptidase YwaD
MPDGKAVTEARVRAHVEMLAAAPRVPSTPEHAAARSYIDAQLRSSGYETRQVRDPLRGGVNVHAVKGDPGKPRFVVGAHYDSVVGSPGADDNASGVAALLEVARDFAASSPTMCVEFVAYDLEENGLVGSHAHCQQLKRDNHQVAGMLSLEMLGFTGEQQILVPGVITSRVRGDFLAVVANETSAHLLDLFEGADGPLPIERVVAPEGTEAGELSQLSDHGSFWSAGWPALLVTDTAMLRNPHYHAKTDVPASLNYTFLAQSARAVLFALLRFTT